MNQSDVDASILVVLCGIAVILFCILMAVLWSDDPSSGVGAGIGGHHYLVTHVTTDQSWNPVIPATPEP